MLYFTEKKHECTGCGACMAVCPVQCISMHKDEEGFLYPTASERCIHCGKCKRVCPIQKEEPTTDSRVQIEQVAVCALTKDHEVWKRSASGGAFSEICKAFGDGNTIVCGASWDGLRVHHICVEGVDAIAPLCKSKYVASDTEKVFSEIQSALRNGKKVIFCGTPCQVAGLRQVIGTNTDNLLCIDLICHGVGSPDVFKACIEQIGKQLGGEVISYEFRAKRTTYETDHIQSTNLADGKHYYLSNDPYIQLFLNQNCLRPSCGRNCHFRCEERQGDITIADFKGLTKVFPFLTGTKKNYSSIIFNTQKGLNLLPTLKKNMVVYSCDIEDIKKYNPLFCRQTWFSEDRDSFFKEFVNNPDEAIEHHTKTAGLLRMSWKKQLWMTLPQIVRRTVLTYLVRRGGTNEYEMCSISRIVLRKP